MYLYRQAAAIAAFFGALTASAQYNISTLFLQGSKIPNSNNTWYVNPGTIPTLPLSISGKDIAFIQCSPCDFGPQQTTDGVWVLDWTTNTFTQLVAVGDIPKGAGETELTSFGAYALVAGGRVVFLGYTSGGDGFYSVPVGGGAISVIADQNTVLPGLGVPGTYSFGNSTTDFPQSDGKTFVFAAATPAGSAVFSSALNGSNLTELAGPNTPLPADAICPDNTGAGTAQPRIKGANSIFDVASFYNGYLYTLGPAGTPPPLCILDSQVPLPDGVQFNYASYTAIDNQQIYFTAANGVNGIFSLPFDGGAPVEILSPTQALPGIPAAASSTINGIGAENGTLIFNFGVTSGNANSGLFAAQGGEITRIAGTGDIIGGQVGNGWLPPIGPNSISDGRVVFSFGESRIGIFLASPTACAADVTSELSVTQTPPHFDSATGDYYSKVTIANTGSETIAAPVAAVFNGLVKDTLTYGTQPPEVLNQGAGSTACLSPLGEAYLVVNGDEALAPGAETSVLLRIADPANVPVSFTTRVVSGKPR